MTQYKTTRATLAAMLAGALGLGAALLAAPSSAVAQGFVIPESGTRKNAMGAVIGRPDDPSAVFHNPAGLAQQQGTRIYLSFGSVFLRSKFRLKPWNKSDQFLTEYQPDAEGYYPEDSPSTFAAIPMIVASTNLWTNKLVGALSIYIPSAAGARFDDNSVARYHMINAYILAGFASGTLAYQIAPWLSVGAGISAAYVRISSRRLLFSADIDGKGSPTSDLSAALGKNSALELVGTDVVPVFNFGIYARPLPSLSLGFSLSSGYHSTLEGDIDITIRGKGDPLHGTHVTEADAPWQFNFGANWDVTRWLEVGAEMRYYTNSVVKEQVSKIDIALPGFSELRIPQNWENNYQASGGVNVKPWSKLPLELMAGIHYQAAGSPANTVNVAAPSYSHVGSHVGGRYEIGPYRLGLAYSHYEYLERRNPDGSLTIPPTNFIGSGRSDIITVIFESRLGSGIGM